MTASAWQKVPEHIQAEPSNPHRYDYSKDPLVFQQLDNCQFYPFDTHLLEQKHSF